MKIFAKTVFLSLIIIICFHFTFGQSRKNYSSDFDFFQGRDLAKYAQNQFWCGGIRKSDECNKEKMADFVWECWNKKTLCYLAITMSGVDSSFTKHLFIEPNKKNQWIVLGYGQLSQPLFKPQVKTLPTIYFLEWKEDKGKKVLVFKNKQKKIIEKFLY